MTFSISKSYISLCMGIAVNDGIIPDIHAPVRNIVKDGGFESEQNKNITWAHMLQLTSEWEGTLWEKPDWIDHYRDVVGNSLHSDKRGSKRKLQPPGTYWEYNDVRVNRLSLALMHAFGRPLPEVLKDRIMDPIGASETWEWHGYNNSWLEINGKRLQSVSGGAHWGGGLWISSLDHARVGQLMLNKGWWNGREIISKKWIDECLTQSPLSPVYGYLWWLNGKNSHMQPRIQFTFNGSLNSNAPTDMISALGKNGQIINIVPSKNMVIVRMGNDPDTNSFISATYNLSLIHI